MLELAAPCSSIKSKWLPRNSTTFMVFSNGITSIRVLYERSEINVCCDINGYENSLIALPPLNKLIRIPPVFVSPIAAYVQWPVSAK